MKCKGRFLLFFLVIIYSGFRCMQTEKGFIDTKYAYFGQNPPGIIPEIFAPGIVSDTSWKEHCRVVVSPNGKEIYWSCFSDGPERIYFSKWKNGKWTKPAHANFVKTDSLNYGGPTFSPDGKKLFFYSHHQPGGIGYIDAWYVERTDGGWVTRLIWANLLTQLAIIDHPYSQKMVMQFAREEIFLRFKANFSNLSIPMTHSLNLLPINLLKI